MTYDPQERDRMEYALGVDRLYRHEVIRAPIGEYERWTAPDGLEVQFPVAGDTAAVIVAPSGAQVARTTEGSVAWLEDVLP